MKIEEKRVLLRNRGKIDPENAREYIAAGGYEGLKRALNMNGEEIIKELEHAGLRGRGGAGFRLTENCSLPTEHREM